MSYKPWGRVYGWVAVQTPGRTKMDRTPGDEVNLRVIRHKPWTRYIAQSLLSVPCSALPFCVQIVLLIRDIIFLAYLLGCAKTLFHVRTRISRSTTLSRNLTRLLAHNTGSNPSKVHPSYRDHVQLRNKSVVPYQVFFLAFKNEVLVGREPVSWHWRNAEHITPTETRRCSNKPTRMLWEPS